MPSYLSDRYKVGRMLGDGNFAVVRECVEHSTGREYALKIINKGKCRGKVNKKTGLPEQKSTEPTQVDVVLLIVLVLETAEVQNNL